MKDIFFLHEFQNVVNYLDFLNSFFIFLLQAVDALLLCLRFQDQNSIVTELNTPVNEYSKLTVQFEIFVRFFCEAGQDVSKSLLVVFNNFQKQGVSLNVFQLEDQPRVVVEVELNIIVGSSLVIP